MATTQERLLSAAPNTHWSFTMQDQNFSGVDIVVHIHSSLESGQLYKMYKEEGWTFKQDKGTSSITIGKLDNRPVCVSPWLHEIEGIKVLYLEATSMLVDYQLIENWILPKLRPEVEIITEPGNLIGPMRELIDEKAKRPTGQVIMGVGYPITSALSTGYVKEITLRGNERYVVLSNNLRDAIIYPHLDVLDMVEALNVGLPVHIVDRPEPWWKFISAPRDL